MIRTTIVALACLYAPQSLAEVFLDLGVNGSRIESLFGDQSSKVESTGGGVHLGFGVRRGIAERSDLSVRIEIDKIDSDTFLAVRAFDYRFNFSDRIAASAFFGAARLDLDTPAYGYYLGGGIQWKELLENWDLNLDLRYGDKVARDNVLPTDPQGGRPDNFHDVFGISLYLSRRF